MSGLIGRARPRGEQAIELGLRLCAWLTVFTTIGIIGVLAMETVSFFGEVSLWEFLTDTEWTPLFAEKRFGVWPLLSGTLLITAIALSVAIPNGLLAAIYLSELAPPRARAVLKPMLEVLAGVPTIVYGYFALLVVTPLLQGWVPGLAGFNSLGPGIVMGLMILPTISSLSSDALDAVPMAQREAAWALGAGRIPTILRVVLPSARSGISASAILAVSRAIGETMIVAIAAGQQARLTIDPRVPVETMTAYIVQVSMGDTPTGTLEYRTIFVIGASLFLMTFGMNVIGHRLARAGRR